MFCTFTLPLREISKNVPDALSSVTIQIDGFTGITQPKEEVQPHIPSGISIGVPSEKHAMRDCLRIMIYKNSLRPFSVKPMGRLDAPAVAIYAS